MAVLPLNAVIGGKYRIEKLIGSGGMGEVYRATNLHTKTPVAVKALTSSRESGTALARFRNEAVIQYNLRHPNVAELYEYAVYQDTPCIVMELVEGRTLNSWIREVGSLDVRRSLEILADVCDAVSYMHSKGTIHRDIKSENIRVNAQGRAKLLDFGIAVGKYTPNFTRVGASIGTPEKMAPEQHQGLRGDARSDVWALGVLLYEMVTGVLPFSNSSEEGLRQDVMAVRYVPARKRRPGLPSRVVRIISMCLRLKPEERYASSGVMLREVQQTRRRLDSSLWSRIRIPHPAYVATGLALLAMGLFLYAFDFTSRSDNSSSRNPPASSTPTTPPVDGNNAGLPSSLPVRESGNMLRSRPNAAAVASQPAGQTHGVIEHEAMRTPDFSTVDQTTVNVVTYDGTAEVATADGKLLGSTPYPLRGPLGTNYKLQLRRQGYQTRDIDVQINANKTEYLFGLEKN